MGIEGGAHGRVEIRCDDRAVTDRGDDRHVIAGKKTRSPSQTTPKTTPKSSPRPNQLITVEELVDFLGVPVAHPLPAVVPKRRN